jgi:hypothetical protein
LAKQKYRLEPIELVKKKLADMRIAMISSRTCPFATLGGKDMGGMNVYVNENTRSLGAICVHIDEFTRS